MKTAKFVGENIVEIVEKPMPHAQKGEIVVKVAYCGLCGSEKRIVRSGFDTCTPGHEICGTVYECGSDPAPFEVGAPVLIYLSNYCGECPACREGNTSQCENRKGLVGWHFDGGYAEYVKVPEHMVYSLKTLPLKYGVLVLDTIGTAFHGLRLGDIKKGQSVCVLGCGPIGLGCIGILKDYYGIEELYAADTSAYHLKIANELGAETILIDPADTGLSLANGLEKKVDTIIEVVGADATIAASLKCIKAGGKVVLIGEPEKALHVVRSADWVLKDFSLINSWYFPTREIDENLEFSIKHQDTLKTIATHYFPIEKMTEAYRTFCSGETGKVLIDLNA